MSLVHRNRMEIKLGEYAVGQAASLVDPRLVTKAQDYRRHIASRMIPLEAEDILKRFPKNDYFVSLKVDGEFNLLVYEDGEAILVNPGGTVRMGLPLLREAVERFKHAGVRQAILTGEFYFSKSEGKRPRVHDVSRVARSPASQAELDLLNFATCDVLEIDGNPGQGRYALTLPWLEELFSSGKRIHSVETHRVSDAEAIQRHFRLWVDQGAEGAVVRSDDVGMFKIKPRHTIDAVVIGFTESADDREGMIHDLLLALMRPDGCLHIVGHVGGGLSNDDRRAFLSDLKDMVVESDYVEVNDQVAYHMVRPQWVIEISVLDLIAQSTRGSAINKMVLTWDASANRYRTIRRLPSVAMISPQFLGRREDKSVNRDDIRLQQVTDIVEVPLADRDARQLQLAPSTLLKREVQTKEMKGQTLVRKLLMWQTNKERESEDYPAYVIHLTDFSPNRKTPLERDIRISNSREQIESLWSELAAETFTKGWTLVTNPPSADSTAVAPAAKRKPKDSETAADGESVEPKKKAVPRKKKEA